jgi:rod shape determining protein RodA
MTLLGLPLLGPRRGGFFASGRGRRRRWFDGVDKLLWWIPLGMIFVAGILIASTQRQAGYADWYQHWITAAVGMAIALLLARVPVESITRWPWVIYGAMVASLIAVRVVGVSALGAQSWINIAGFHVQPSEFAKVGAILLLARVLGRHPVERPVDLLRPVAIIGLPWLLVLIQPDLGSSLVFGAVLLVMMFWSGMPGAWVLLFISPVISAIVAGVFPWLLLGWIPAMAYLAWKSLPWKRLAPLAVVAVEAVFSLATPLLWNNFLQPHQRDRLTLFLDPNKDPLGGGYHLLQSTVGIGSGGWFGTGLMQGHLTLLRFIPEQHTDFIFSALGEETGFIGSALVVVGFVVWIWRLLQIAGKARSDVESLVVVGIGAMVMFQVVVNINMTIGLGPITGIPLPWLSYGRSAMLVNFIALGLSASVGRRGSTGTGRW